MTVLLVLLCGTNLIAVALLVRSYRSRPAVPVRDVATVLGDGPPPAGNGNRTRRVITVEILNPLELAAHRGRVAGIAGSLAPGLVRRLVHDQMVKRLQRELAAERVAADIRLHTLRPVVADPAAAAPISSPPAMIVPAPAEPHADGAEETGPAWATDDAVDPAEPSEPDQPPTG